MRDIIISSGEINTYGYRIEPEGIRLERYKKNPVLLWNHEGHKVSIGRVDNLRVEAGKLIGTPVFDEDDTLGKEIKLKYEKGFLNACSIWHSPVTLSTDPEDVKPGQTRATVKETYLNEISMVNVPGDPGAHRLSAGEDIDEAIPQLQLSKKSQPKEIDVKELQDIALKLGLEKDASKESILAAIDAMKTEVSNALTAKVDALVQLGKDKGVIANDEQEQAYRTLAMDDYDNASKLVQLATNKQEKKDEDESIRDLLLQMKQEGTGNQKETDAERFDRLQKQDPKELYRLKREEPETYERLILAYSKTVNQ